MRFTLFDDDDLKRVEDTIAKAVTRAIVSALRIAVREGLMLRQETNVPDDVIREVPKETLAVEPVPAPPPSPPPPPPEEEKRHVPRFLKPAPELPFPPGKAVEPPPLKHMAKTRKLYLSLYKTVADRPEGYISVPEAVNFMGGAKFSGPISTWLQKGELEAVIVANYKPPTKGLPGRLMISKQSLVRRDQLRRANRHAAPRNRKSGEQVAENRA